MPFEQNKPMDSSFFKQSGFYVNNEIQQLYTRSSDYLSIALNYHHRGVEGQQIENQFRMQGVDAFQKLLNKSVHLPNVKQTVSKTPEKIRGFSDTLDLRMKLAASIKEHTPTKEIFSWWDAYVTALVEVGLIKIYTQDDSPMAKFRR